MVNMLKRKREENSCPKNYLKLVIHGLPDEMTNKEIKRYFLPGFEISDECIKSIKTRKTSAPDTKRLKKVVIEFQHTCLSSAAKTLINRCHENVYAEYLNDKKLMENPQIFNGNKRPRLMKENEIRISKQICAHQGCEKEAMLVCENCLTLSTGIFYCSHECQGLHWNVHRFDCRKLPKLLDFVQAEEKIENLKSKTNNYTPPKPKIFEENETAVITHIENPMTFYMRSSNDKSDYEKFRKEVEENKNLKKLDDEKPIVDNIQLAPFEGRYCRAKILSVVDHEMKCKVQLLDYGNILKAIPWKSLRKLSYRDRQKNLMTQKVLIDGVKMSKNEEADGYLKSIKNETFKIRRAEEKENSRIVILERMNGENVNQKLMELLTEKIEQTQQPEDVNINATIKVGAGVKIFINDKRNYETHGFISAIDTANKFKFTKFKKDLKNYSSKSLEMIPQPEPNHLYFARCGEERFERVIVTTIGNGKSKIISIDTFEEFEVDNDVLFYLKPELQTLFCCKVFIENFKNEKAINLIKNNSDNMIFVNLKKTGNNYSAEFE